MTVLFVVLTFILFVLVDILVLKAHKKKLSELNLPPIAVFSLKNLLHPEKFYISPGHTWVQVLQDGLVKIGIDDFVLKAFGKLSIINISGESTIVKKGDIVFQGAFDGKSVSFRSPVDGVVKFVNKEIVGNIVDDPYNESWGLIISPTKLEENLQSIKSGNELTKWLKNEFVRLKDFLSVNMANVGLAGVTMHDGGNIIEGAVAKMNDKGVQNFEKEFLTF